MDISFSIWQRILNIKLEVKVKKTLFLFLLIAGISIQAQTSQKIGYVDSQVILNQYSAAIKAQSDIDALVAGWTKVRDSLATVLQGAYADYQKQEATMTPEVKAQKQQELITMQQNVERFNAEKFGQQTGEVYRKTDEILAPVKQKIFSAIDEVAKQEQMKFVFDKTGDVILLYADPEFDITFKVLDKLKTK
ncbi:MAG: OmpH family outer membrane protein [bacterium]